MLVLIWAKSKPNIDLVWVGPTKITSAVSSVEEIQQKFAVVSGPRGAKGEKGDPGEVGGVPTALDGGNF